MPTKETSSIYTRLINVQNALKAPKNKDNSFGKYKYRSLEDILENAKPLLKDNGLMLILDDDIVEISGRFYVKARATVIDEDGNEINAVAYARESESKSGMDAAQLTGSCSSYARKYAVSGLFCIDNNKDIDSDEYTAADAAAPAKTTRGRKTKTTEPAAPVPEPVPTESAPVLCDDCGAIITPVKTEKANYTVAAIIASTQKSFGVNCCFKCGALRAQRAKAERAAAANNTETGVM